MARTPARLPGRVVQRCAWPRPALAITVLFACNAASAAEEMPAIETVRCCTLADAGALPPSNDADRLAPRGRPWRSNALLAGYVGFVSVYGYFAWWNKDVQRHVRAADGTVSTETLPNRTSSFRMASEGGFSRDSVAGGADKLGHAMAFYASTRLLASTLDLWAGQPLHEAIRVAGFASAAVSLAVEVLDGYSLEYGFSTGDLAMNLLGIGAGMLLESSPRLDALIDLRWKYRRSADARWLGDRDPIADYSGHTYLLVLKASGVPQWQSHSWLRYGELHFGYGSRGYAPHPGRFAPVQPRPHRNLYFGVGINLSELLGATVFTGESRARRIADTALEYLQVPGTHLLLRQGLDD